MMATASIKATTPTIRTTKVTMINTTMATSSTLISMEGKGITMSRKHHGAPGRLHQLT